MCPDSEFQEKMGVLDLIINVLKDHEVNLDKLSDKFENIVENLYSVESKILSLNETFAQSLFSRSSNNENRNTVALAECSEWNEFRDRSEGVNVVAFEAKDKIFTVNALVGDIVYKYCEPIPELKFQVEEGDNRYIIKKMTFSNSSDIFSIFEKRLKCGLEVYAEGSNQEIANNERLLVLRYQVDPDEAKHWLSNELSVPKENIIEGKLSIRKSS